MLESICGWEKLDNRRGFNSDRQRLILGDSAPQRGTVFDCQLLAAGSIGRRNSVVKSLRRGLEVQRFPRSFVELPRHLVQLGLGEGREIKAFGEVLAQQAVGVFV
jgi:hypothetical protein